MKKWLLVFLAATALLAATFFGNPQRQINHFVRDNREELEAVLRECWADPSQAREYKQHAIHVATNEVWFDWSGSGLGPATRYYSFYYSVDKAPHPYPGMAHYDETVQMFSWTWRQPDGDNGCQIRHIVGNWYYCEAWF